MSNVPICNPASSSPTPFSSSLLASLSITSLNGPLPQTVNFSPKPAKTKTRMKLRSQRLNNINLSAIDPSLELEIRNALFSPVC
ncbi:unnamed protein product [Linum tenue]|uniref:Uncharacterized protein n=1 Tax=Linum tenue TaxID=586396 RepID=A0AAV0QYZ0_9ROSI|nr:unnamed protein product [Linum tenue]